MKTKMYERKTIFFINRFPIMNIFLVLFKNKMYVIELVTEHQSETDLVG